MGYTTEFDGEFTIVDVHTGKPAKLSDAQIDYINKFCETRRMKRNEFKTVDRSDPVREAVGLPVWTDGAYFVGEGGFAGQDDGADVVDHNKPPAGQPGLWCHWCTEDGTQIYWDGGEKFYSYAEWLAYILHHFLVPWGFGLTGAVKWRGEEFSDMGVLTVLDNVNVWTGTPEGDTSYNCKASDEGFITRKEDAGKLINKS